MPEEIKAKLEELRQLVTAHPLNIPLRDAADFLGMNDNGLRAALMNGTAPFGFGYQLDKNGYRVFVIPAVKFYLWYTNANGGKEI